jgi:iron-sulfur cluster assembly accessory protein
MTIEIFDPKAAVLTITEAAAAHVRRQLANAARRALRLSVTESGCSGYMYELDYTDAPQPDDLICELDGDIPVYVSADVVPLIRGTQIDYVREGINASLKFRNPNADTECGCGESFSVTKAAAT